MTLPSPFISPLPLLPQLESKIERSKISTVPFPLISPIIGAGVVVGVGVDSAVGDSVGVGETVGEGVGVGEGEGQAVNANEEEELLLPLYTRT